MHIRRHHMMSNFLRFDNVLSEFCYVMDKVVLEEEKKLTLLNIPIFSKGSHTNEFLCRGLNACTSVL